MNIANLDKQINALERTSRALELRKSGMTYALIADELGYKSTSGAHNAVTRALKKTLQDSSDEVRILEVERLDALLNGLWPRRHIPEYTDRILRVMDRRAKLLGLDAPTRSDITSGGEVIPIVYVNDWRESGE